MQPDYLIGVDVGTSSTKAIAFSVSGQRLAVGRADHATLRDAHRGVRQDPEAWWESLRDAVRQVVQPDAACLGIGVAAQIGTHVAVGHDLQPLDLAWTWQDGQAACVLRDLSKAVDLAALAADLRTWLPLGPTWPLPRLLWLREHQPALFRRTRFLALPKDILLHRLTGQFVTDASSWRGLAKVNGDLHTAALDGLGLPDLVAPRLAPTDTAGPLRPEVARQLGLPPTTAVFVGSSDYACALVGGGVAQEGDCFDIGGTSEHLGVLSVRRPADPSAISVPYLAAEAQGAFVNYGVSSNAGGVVRWLSSLGLAGSGSTKQHADLFHLASQAPPGSDGLVFLPYIHAERSPIWDASATGSWVGLRASHGAAHLVRAALEGVVFNLRQIRNSLAPLPFAGRVRATGGTAGSALWNEIKAAVLGAPIGVMAEPEAGALGAAIYAAVGLGLFPEPIAGMRAMARVARTVTPDPALVDLYDAAFARYEGAVSSRTTP